MDPSPQEVELTPEMIEYARAVALKEAPWHCGPGVSFEDVAHEAVLQLMRRPPKYDPSRGADVKTLIYTIVFRAVIKYATREGMVVRRLKPFIGTSDDAPDAPPGPTVDQVRTHHRLTGKWPTRHEASQALVEEMLRFIDNAESRAMCRYFIDYKGNKSKVAKRMKLTEGAVRHRLKMLGPKLRAAGFDPFPKGGDI